MNSIFIQEDETMEVKIFIGSSVDKKGVLANKDKELLLEEENLDKKSVVEYTITLKKPSYKEEVLVMKKALITSVDGINLDFIVMNYARMVSLLVGWTFVNEDKTSIAVNEKNINKLHPAVANAIINIISDYT